MIMALSHERDFHVVTGEEAPWGHLGQHFQPRTIYICLRLSAKSNSYLIVFFFHIKLVNSVIIYQSNEQDVVFDLHFFLVILLIFFL